MTALCKRAFPWFWVHRQGVSQDAVLGKLCFVWHECTSTNAWGTALQWLGLARTGGVLGDDARVHCFVMHCWWLASCCLGSSEMVTGHQSSLDCASLLS